MQARVLSVLASALLAALAAVALAASGGTLDVVGLVSNPRAFQDRNVTLSGVMWPGTLDYRVLYQDEDTFFSKRHPDLQNYVELDGLREVWVQQEKYFGANVTVTGRYHHDCMPSQAGRLCFDHGRNGIVAVTGIQLNGYIDAKKFPRDYSDPGDRLVAVPETATLASGLRELIEGYVIAVREHDAERLAALFVADERSAARQELADRTSRDWWRAFAPEMRFNAGQLQSGINFTLLRWLGEPPRYFLCFCRTPSCERAWPAAVDEIYLTNIRDPHICRQVRSEGGHWRLSRDD